MKLSHKLEYACRVLAQLARTHGQEQLAHIEMLAEAEAIPANYLVQILNELRNGGLIVSKRGKQGGYALARSPNSIRLAEIVRIIDADLLDATVSEAGSSGRRVAAVWAEIGASLEEKIAGYTLEDLVAAEAGGMYYI